MTNLTCKYCGSDLDKHLYCPFCGIIFSLEDCSMNGKRISQLIDDVPFIENEEELLSRSTKDLLKEKTITLYYLLRAARKHRGDYYKEPDKADLFNRIAFVIENILLEREGSFPKRLTNSVLHKKFNEIQTFEKELISNGKFSYKNVSKPKED